MSRTERGLPALHVQVVSEGGHCAPCMIAIDATREVTAEFGDDVLVEVVTLKEHEGAERYRELRRSAEQHLPVPCVLLEGRLVSPGIPEPEALRAVIVEALAAGPAPPAKSESDWGWPSDLVARVLRTDRRDRGGPSLRGGRRTVGAGPG